MKWLTLAAEQGFAPSQSGLGYMYEKGLGVEQNYFEAVKWYTLAADQGLARGQYNLGYMYENGLGILKDKKVALELYKKAAEQGHANSHLNIGMMYLRGDKIIGAKNNIIAFMRFSIAAPLGSKEALNNMSYLFTVMTPSQIQESQKLARECVKQNYKGC